MLFLALAAITGAPAWGQEPAPSASSAPSSPVALTLREAVQRALTANPVLGQSQREAAVAEAQTDVIFSAILPRIGFEAGYTRNTEEVAFGLDDGRQTTILPENDWSYRLTLSQPIYAGNRERKAIRQSRLTAENARQGVAGTEEQLIASVVGNYLAVLQAQDLLAVERRNLELAQRRRAQAQIFFDAGETTRVDVLRAESSIKGAERRVAAALQAREAAIGELRLDLALENAIDVSAPGDLFPPLPAEPALVAEAERRRTEVLQAANAYEISRLEVGKQRGAWLPTVTADGSYIKQRSTFPADQYGSLTLNFNVPIYSSGEISSRVAIARERERQAELRLQEVRQAVREQVHQALVDLRTTDASLRLAQEQLAASEAEFAQATELYRAQELTALEVDTAQASLAEAQRAVAAGRIDRALAELRVWAAAGMIEEIIPPEGVNP